MLFDGSTSFFSLRDDTIMRLKKRRKKKVEHKIASILTDVLRLNAFFKFYFHEYLNTIKVSTHENVSIRN